MSTAAIQATPTRAGHQQMRRIVITLRGATPLIVKRLLRQAEEAPGAGAVIRTRGAENRKEPEIAGRSFASQTRRQRCAKRRAAAPPPCQRLPPHGVSEGA